MLFFPNCPLLILTIILALFSKHTPTCEHETLQKAQPTTLAEPGLDTSASYTPNATDRSLAAYNWSLRTLRLTNDFSFMDAFAATNSISTAKITMVKNAIETSKRYLTSYFQVLSLQSYNLATSTTSTSPQCSNLTIPPIGNVETDLTVFFNGYTGQENTTSIANSVYCIQDPLTKRPLIGVINVNFAKIKTQKFYELYYFPMFLHQYFHIMGFSYELFGQFYNQDTTRHISEVVQPQFIGVGNYTGFI